MLKCCTHRDTSSTKTVTSFLNEALISIASRPFQAFRRPLPVYDTARGGVDSLVRGMCGFASQQYDNFITKQVTRSLFTENPPFGPGMDLMSLNIQRGRDHGLGSKSDEGMGQIWRALHIYKHPSYK